MQNPFISIITELCGCVFFRYAKLQNVPAATAHRVSQDDCTELRKWVRSGDCEELPSLITLSPLPLPLPQVKGASARSESVVHFFALHLCPDGGVGRFPMHERENINQTDKDAHVLVPYVASQSGDLLCSKLQVFLFKEQMLRVYFITLPLKYVISVLLWCHMVPHS